MCFKAGFLSSSDCLVSVRLKNLCPLLLVIFLVLIVGFLASSGLLSSSFVRLIPSLLRFPAQLFFSLHESVAFLPRNQLWRAVDNTSASVSKLNYIFFGYFDLEMIFLDNENNNFPGELTDISAKTEALDNTQPVIGWVLLKIQINFDRTIASGVLNHSL